MRNNASRWVFSAWRNRSPVPHCSTASCGTLGVAGEDLESRPVEERQQAVPPVQPLRVLLAEDTTANQKLVQYILADRGHSVEVARNGQEAVQLVARQEFDLVLMDVQMPVMDGFRATTAIRELPAGQVRHSNRGDDGARPTRGRAAAAWQPAWMHI